MWKNLTKSCWPPVCPSTAHQVSQQSLASTYNKSQKIYKKAPPPATTVPSGTRRHPWGIDIQGYTFGSLALATNGKKINKIIASSHHCPLRHQAPSLGHWYTRVYLRISGNCNKWQKKISQSPPAVTTVPSRTRRHPRGIGIPGYTFWSLAIATKGKQNHHNHRQQSPLTPQASGAILGALVFNVTLSTDFWHNI